MNFILFNPDEMRAESVGCYGHPLVQTPNIDRLAAEGTRFDQAFCQHTVCTPSRCSYVTGWYPHVRGHRTLWHCLRPDEPNLYGYLREAGYHNWWHGGHNDMLAEATFRRDVCQWDAPRGPDVAFTGGNPFAPDDPRYYSFLHAPYEGPAENHHDWRMVAAAIDFIRSKPTQPFSIHLPLILPHCPYGVPQPWHDMFDPADLPPLRPAGLPDRPDYHELIRQYRRLGEMPGGTLEKINAVYLGMIAFSDHLLGLLLDALAETGLDEETTVLHFSDHGDYAGDYGLVEKWPSGLEDVLTRVPLVVRTPGGKAGHVVDEPVELFDIMPTCLDLAGIECRHTHFAHSLLPQLHGATGDGDRAAFAEGGYDEHELHCFEARPGSDAELNGEHIYTPKARQQRDDPQSVSRATMIRTAGHKLVRRPGGQHELYDLTTDPQELTNLYDRPAHAAIQNELTTRLLDWAIHTADVVPFDRDSRGIPPNR